MARIEQVLGIPRCSPDVFLSLVCTLPPGLVQRGSITFAKRRDITPIDLKWTFRDPEDFYSIQKSLIPYYGEFMNLMAAEFRFDQSPSESKYNTSGHTWLTLGKQYTLPLTVGYYDESGRPFPFHWAEVWKRVDFEVTGANLVIGFGFPYKKGVELTNWFMENAAANSLAITQLGGR